MNTDLETILRKDLHLTADQLAPDASLEDAGFDSLAVVELSVLLHDRHGVDVTDAEIKDAATLRDLDLLIERKRIRG